MAGSNINPRVQQLATSNDNEGKCILYVMSRDQRVRDNHALTLAQQEALQKKLPLAVIFCVAPKSGFRAREHYEWMFVGLEEVERKLIKLNIPLLFLVGDSSQRLEGAISHLEPETVYFDMNPLRGPRILQDGIRGIVSCNIFLVDTHNIVPVWITSNKQEYSARTIRPKIHQHLSSFLVEPEEPIRHPVDWPGIVMSIAQLRYKTDQLLGSLTSNGQKSLLKLYPTGNNNARSHLASFIHNRLQGYDTMRNDPTIHGLSGLSPYLHFGRVSSLRVVLEAQKYVQEHPEAQKSLDTLIEEIVVRKELSDNYCYYNLNYDKLMGAPEWARTTLATHQSDDRGFLYSLEEFAGAQTHDLAWNAAQQQLVQTGKIHGYMRMYWAKKVLEWSESPEEAIGTLIYLNDFYSIDGGDPNGYVGILWSVAGLHDRAWGERPVYGTIRSMVYSGLRRKFDVEKYEKRWLP